MSSKFILAATLATVATLAWQSAVACVGATALTAPTYGPSTFVGVAAGGS